MISIYLFMAFFIANLLGYGGGPASIPLMFEEVVNRYSWLSNDQFSNMLALANALPARSPRKSLRMSATAQAGRLGFLIALIATVVPSALALIVLLRIIQRFRQSPVIKGMTLSVQPVIAVMMLILTWQIGADGIKAIGWVQSIVIAGISLLAMTKFKMHPAFLIIAAFLYGVL
nr:chromate transporter [Bacillus subtilis]